MHRYEKNAFDAIIIDEAHHSAANSYKKVLDYFEPKLWLAMTATPDKRDDFGYSGDRVKGLIFCSRMMRQRNCRRNSMPKAGGHWCWVVVMRTDMTMRMIIGKKRWTRKYREE